ncbi:MAG: c-type cytochrome [Myxococcales bacterium]|jgi:mono/diheme cytochrome c family protein
MTRRACLLLLLLCPACRDDASLRAPDPDLARSAAYESFARPMAPPEIRLAPADGSVPRGQLPFRYGPGAAEAARAGRELTNPLAPTASNRARGAKVYEARCAVCHGRSGAGDGPVVGALPPPPSLTTGRTAQVPDGELFHAATRGSGRMAGHEVELTADDRWRVVLFARELQRQAER